MSSHEHAGHCGPHNGRGRTAPPVLHDVSWPSLLVWGLAIVAAALAVGFFGFGAAPWLICGCVLRADDGVDG
ncbi:MAG: hypothetical protein ACRD1H_08545, partial [Vicinamibacterales bacterium]